MPAASVMALALFELDFAAFTQLPSRFSAEPLARVSRFGFLMITPVCGFPAASVAFGLSDTITLACLVPASPA